MEYFQSINPNLGAETEAINNGLVDKNIRENRTGRSLMSLWDYLSKTNLPTKKEIDYQVIKSQQRQAQGQMPQQEQLPQEMTPDEMAMQEQEGVNV